MNQAKVLKPLFDKILEHIPGPLTNEAEAFKMLVANLDYSDYLGQLAIGKVLSGAVSSQESLVRIGSDDEVRPLKVVKLQTYQGLQVAEIDRV